MKKSIMLELYYGNNASYDTIKTSDEYKKLADKSLKQYDELEQTLNEEQKKQLEKLLDLEMYQSADFAESNFIEGLKLGIRLGVEAMDE